MMPPEDTHWCRGCGVEISWGPFMAGGRAYCCRDCSESRACDSGERMEQEEDRRQSPATGTPLPTSGPYLA